MVRKSHSQDEDDDTGIDVDLLLEIVAIRARQHQLDEEAAAPNQQQSTTASQTPSQAPAPSKKTSTANDDLTTDDDGDATGTRETTGGGATVRKDNKCSVCVGLPVPRNNDSDIETSSGSGCGDDGPVPPIFQATSFPGAFAVGGLGGGNNNEQDNNDNNHNQDPTSAAVGLLVDDDLPGEQHGDSEYEEEDRQQQQEETAQLITAQAVDDDDEPSRVLPNAEPLAGTTRQTCWKRRRKTFLLLSLEAIGALVLVAIVLVVLILSTQHKQAHDDKTNGRVGEKHKGMIPIIEGTSAHAPPPITLLESLNVPSHTLQALENPTSPQFKAFAWLSSNVQEEGGDKTLPLWRLKQRFALAVFYHSMRGDHWVQNHGWLDWEIDECMWEQPTVDYFEPSTFQACNDNGGEIIRLAFHKENNLDGTIPPEISLLGNSLQSIEILRGLKVKGTLPTEVGLLTSLTRLMLFITHLDGKLPSELGLLGQNLDELWLFDNQIHGIIPSELGSLSKLEVLGLQDTSLSGSLPSEVAGLPSLKCFFVGNSPLSTWSILLEIATTMHKLDELRLQTRSGNAAIAIPSQIGQMTELTRLIVTDWQIHGKLPSEFAEMSQLSSLSLAENSISGYFPQVISKLSELQVLDIASNSFEGKLESSMLSKLTNLQAIRMENNSFSGSLPTGMFTYLTKLEIVHLNDNEFTGSLPTEVGLQSNLIELGLHNTDISGTLPAELSLLPNLTRLVVTNTSLSGRIPDVLCSKIHPPQERKCFGGTCHRVATSNISACHGTNLCGCDCGHCRVRD